MEKLRQVQIPEDLCAAAERRFAGKFHSVDELVAFLLQELLRHDSFELDRAEQAAVEQRLKDLGYL
jgi:Arc/MetJ-type ribon-helix-helix transcriptional regulator